MRISIRLGLALGLFFGAVVACGGSSDAGGGTPTGGGSGGSSGGSGGSSGGSGGGSGSSSGGGSGSSSGGGSGSSSGGSSGGGSGSSSGGADGGAYPAPHLAPPVMVYGGDRLLYAPKIVTVTFPKDTKAGDFESFGDTITATPWWDQVTAGYCDKSGKCIGRGTGGQHVRLPETPAGSYTDSAKPTDASTIKDFIRSHLADKSFPAPDENTLYVIYLPQGVNVTMNNGGQTATSCQQFGGYHMYLPAAGGGAVDAAYAIVPQCASFLGISVADPIEASSHEIIEAATDPLVNDQTANGFYMDQARIAWTSVSAGEVGDACALLQVGGNPLTGAKPEVYKESGFGVQRSWSNKALLAGHDPCVPAGASPYFNVAPLVGGSEKLIMKQGETKVVDLTGFSEGPMADWDVKVMDMSALTPGAQSPLSLSLDAAKANNGTRLHLTVKATGVIDPNSGGASMMLVSTSGKDVSYWPLIVTAN